jgi:hypothetical protein
LLKELFIDSSVKKADKLNEQMQENKTEPKHADKDISWKQFKMMKK